MLNKIRKKIKEQKGFSLAEVLMAVMIVLLVSAVVAAGIPAAVRAYNKVVDSSNAQVLLSNAMTRLRDELGKASEISIGTDNTTISYKNSYGIITKIQLKDNSIYVQEYADYDDNGTYLHPLVSDAASGKTLYITYDSVTNEDGVVAFSDLTVHYKADSSKTLASAESFKVRVLTVTS